MSAFFSEIWKDFVHYYQSRGRAELHSFLITFWSAFASIFLLLGISDLNALFDAILTGHIDHEVLFALGSAGVRSLIGGLLYAFFPEQFADRVFRKR
jgi:hypothetical protein